MSISVLVGAQWGDEGKGKMVDYFAKQSDLIVRFQGGDNAGHTVINDYGIFKLHLIPCGVFNKDCQCLIGTGMVVNPDVLLEEMQQIIEAKLSLAGLKISAKAHILMPYHQKLDELMEASGGIGTTKRGIGQAYAYKAMRKSLRFEDLLNLDNVKKKLEIIVPVVNDQMASYKIEPYTVEALFAKCQAWAKTFSHMIVNPVGYLHDMIEADKKILFEGQLGAMKDIDLGIFPYVTSSNPIAAYAAVSGGFPAKKIDTVIGVAKAFSSAVGAGPFPTEEFGGTIDILRGTGEKPDDEFGARTGRSRRLGWIDIPVLKYTHAINGYDELALCKIDKLDDLPEIKICIDYKLDGELLKSFPSTEDLGRVEPVYITLPGWLSETRGIRRLEDLPENAKKYIKTIEDLVGTTIAYVGVGPNREDLAIR
ncbi:MULTISPECIES: adenylosuccinate synthase [unclassified Acetobacterium]|jgi:adenylosuccinate synthase|uniref:adenylosuccinate synthase n=1 Tax=unclassified Acetobacterium TaxID=2638182 RepID=UPI000DBEB644|nr:MULTISPECIES: adenylosuccinate synthase [unclassified Acetobacterium]AWW27163.1 adenylosuccinate synthase [Acetobacterium sp. KB-1]MDZ5724363.1 adenylosuccinate synthase [Acetobacterium sp. K1/6]